MTEERVTKTVDPEGNTHTTHIVSDSTQESGGSAKWVFLVILVLALGVAAFFFTQSNSAEIAKDTAIGDAANEVSEAAGQIGDAAEQTATEVGEAAQEVGESAQETTEEAAEQVSGE